MQRDNLPEEYAMLIALICERGVGMSENYYRIAENLIQNINNIQRSDSDAAVVYRSNTQRKPAEFQKPCYL